MRDPICSNRDDGHRRLFQRDGALEHDVNYQAWTEYQILAAPQYAHERPVATPATTPDLAIVSSEFDPRDTSMAVPYPATIPARMGRIGESNSAPLP
jgi:hypothetical protein